MAVVTIELRMYPAAVRRERIARTPDDSTSWRSTRCSIRNKRPLWRARYCADVGPDQVAGYSCVPVKTFRPTIGFSSEVTQGPFAPWM